MATNSVKVTLQIRHDTSSNWVTRNPILAQGEYGLELDTFLIKIGDGLRDWTHLPYLNKLNSSYFKWEADGSLTFSDEFLNTIATAKEKGLLSVPEEITVQSKSKIAPTITYREYSKKEQITVSIDEFISMMVKYNNERK